MYHNSKNRVEGFSLRETKIEEIAEIFSFNFQPEMFAGKIVCREGCIKIFFYEKSKKVCFILNNSEKVKDFIYFMLSPVKKCELFLSSNFIFTQEQELIL